MRARKFAGVFPVLALFFALLASSTPAAAQWVPLNPVKEVTLQPDGLLLELQTGFLRFQVNSDSIVHVVYSLEKQVPQHQDFLVIKTQWPKTEFTVQNTEAKVVTLSTSR